MSEQAQPFTALECIRQIHDENGRVTFIGGNTYSIEATYERGTHIIDGQAFHFAQTTFKVTNDYHEVCYVPFNSSDYFTKKRGAVATLVSVPIPSSEW
jgi:hypothetical protein